jgi:hypothetical protein
MNDKVMNRLFIIAALAVILGLFTLCWYNWPTESTEPAYSVPVQTETQAVIETTVPTIQEFTEPTQVSIEPTVELTEPTEPEPAHPPENVQWYDNDRVGTTNTVTTEVCGEEIDRDFLAKMVFAESGGEDWWCQVYTCSAILNHCEVSNMTLWKCGHNANHFAVAPYVDRVTPTDTSYEVVDYVLNGGRIESICYFRTNRYHGFGEPMCKVGAHYFSIK